MTLSRAQLTARYTQLAQRQEAAGKLCLTLLNEVTEMREQLLQLSGRALVTERILMTKLGMTQDDITAACDSLTDDQKAIMEKELAATNDMKNNEDAKAVMAIEGEAAKPDAPDAGGGLRDVDDDDAEPAQEPETCKLCSEVFANMREYVNHNPRCAGKDKKATVEELQAILNDPSPMKVVSDQNGEVRAVSEDSPETSVPVVPVGTVADIIVDQEAEKPAGSAAAN